MTKDEAIARLIEIELVMDKDLDVARADAGEVLCELLLSLGYDDVVVLWREIDEWCL